MGWHLYVNDTTYPIDVFQDGTITFTLEPGKYTVELRYQSSLVFKVGIVFSIVSFLILSALGLGFISEQLTVNS